MEKMKISSEKELLIFKKIISHSDFLGKYYQEIPDSETQNIVDFLNLIWPLSSMPSADPRFKNAEADCLQHLIYNQDWDYEYLFVKRLGLMDGAMDVFSRFIEVIVSPIVRRNIDEINIYVSELNSLLRSDNYELVIFDYVDDLPHYVIKAGLNHSVLKNDVRENDIIVYVKELQDARPCFFLEEYRWDDYGYKTRYRMWYYPENGGNQFVGTVKICKKGVYCTYDELLNKPFFKLNDDFCSLGQDTQYYGKLKNILGDSAKSFLSAIKDAACYSKIADDFVDEGGFRHSLLRELDADTALNIGRYILAGYDHTEKVNFTYSTHMEYGDKETFNIKFDFDRINKEVNYSRVIALIGENGVGKTTLLSNLAKSIASGEKEHFSPHIPLFTKVIAASYSIFDKFYDIDVREFNYVYCGMQKKEGGLLTPMELSKRHKDNAENINKLGRGKYLLIIAV